MFRSILAIALVFTMSFISLVHASIGKVTLLKGQSEVERNGAKTPLHQNDELFELDIVHTAASSFIKMTLNDDTIIQLGPEASFKFSQHSTGNGLRQEVFELIKGKLRTAVHKEAKDGESIKFGTTSIALGVRGTEFLTNTYMVKGKMTTDVLLLKGKIAADASQLGTSVKTFDVSAGQYFNTHQIAQDQGLQSIKTLSPEALQKILDTKDAFLPDLIDAKGVLQDLGSALSSTLGQVGAGTLAGVGAGIGAGVGLLAGTTTGVLAAAASKDDDRSSPSKAQAQTPDQVKPPVQAPSVAPTIVTKETVTIVYKEKETPDPVDIREAKEQRKRMRKENRCYFWFYKIIPGSFTPERFRRERDCDEYEFDL
ncbi:MAG: FecR domain-containing protein [Bdellovibrio sp.]|nr:FecR domain-containing protein [Bdellovibrio sp.]